MATIEPRLYLDTNIILDIIHNRWRPSASLLERAKSEQWKCVTSHFTMLELLDIEHEQCYIDNLLGEGYPLSRVRDKLGNRRQKVHGLPKRDLENTRALLDAHGLTTFSFISFEYPITRSFWDKAESYCESTVMAVADVLHLALAVESECNILVTRDKDFCTAADDFIIAVPPENIDIALERLRRS